ncbi:hypothetical protein I79_017905 [Cricetulus griseus]|uniref:Uncharacterized protein n=1 Tax=Cricetulus griseus TaxID=10029 RepID=G3I3A3_CRIGR|nr:hypothetical protein I79_017905 [Cricetulus griseus]
MTKCAFSSSSISDFPPTSFGTPVWFRGTKEIPRSDPRILDERYTFVFPSKHRNRTRKRSKYIKTLCLL